MNVRFVPRRFRRRRESSAPARRLTGGRRNGVRVVFVAEDVDAIFRQLVLTLIRAPLQQLRFDALEDLVERHLDHALLFETCVGKCSRRRLPIDARQRHLHRATRKLFRDRRHRQRNHRLGIRHARNLTFQIGRKTLKNRKQRQRRNLHAWHRKRRDCRVVRRGNNLRPDRSGRLRFPKKFREKMEHAGRSFRSAELAQPMPVGGTVKKIRPRPCHHGASRA